MFETATLLSILAIAATIEFATRKIPGDLVGLGILAAVCLPLARYLLGGSPDVGPMAIGALVCGVAMSGLWRAAGRSTRGVGLAMIVGALVGWRQGLSILLVAHALLAGWLTIGYAVRQLGFQPAPAGGPLLAPGLSGGDPSADGSSRPTGEHLPIAQALAIAAGFTLLIGGPF